MSLGFEFVSRFQLDAMVTSISIGEDDRTAAAICDDKILKIDLNQQSQRPVCQLPYSAPEISLAAARQRVAVTTGTESVDIYDLNRGQRVQRMRRDGAPGSLRTAEANHIALSPDARMLVTTTTGSRIFVSNVESGEWEHIMFVKYDGCDVCICPRGKYVGLFGAAKASELSGQLTVYLVRRGLQPLWTAWHETDEKVIATSFTHDSESIVSCSNDGARVWDTTSGKLQHHVKPKTNEPVRNAWCPGDRRYLASLGSGLSVVELVTGKHVFHRHIEPYNTTAVSPSGRWLLLAHADASLSAWKAEPT